MSVITRALGRSRTARDADAITGGRTARRVMPTVGMVRSAPTRINESYIPRHWRASHLYERRYLSRKGLPRKLPNTRPSALKPYLYSRERDLRMVYCTSIRRVLDPQDVETILYIYPKQLEQQSLDRLRASKGPLRPPSPGQARRATSRAWSPKLGLYGGWRLEG